MRELALTTPALCFSALSLLLLAYTNRFLSYAQLVRNLYRNYKENGDKSLLGEIANLRKRLNLIKHMQFQGIFSLLLCVVTMLCIYIHANAVAVIVFGVALITLTISLALSMWEILISVRALNLHLDDIENNK